MNRNTKLERTGMVIGFIGMGLIIWKAGWVVALGIFLALWGNNVESRGRNNRAYLRKTPGW